MVKVINSQDEYKELKKKGITTVLINGYKDEACIIAWLGGTNLYRVEEGVYIYT